MIINNFAPLTTNNSIGVMNLQKPMQIPNMYQHPQTGLLYGPGQTPGISMNNTDMQSGESQTKCPSHSKDTQSARSTPL